jgi:hypothetical protein
MPATLSGAFHLPWLQALLIFLHTHALLCPFACFLGCTFLLGSKWHLGFFKWAYTPTFRGFDSFVGFYSGGEDYFSHVSSGGFDFRRDPSPRCGKNCSQVDWQAQGSYSTEVFAQEAVTVIDQHKASAPPDTPLFLYLAFQGVHAPSEAPQKYLPPLVPPSPVASFSLLTCGCVGVWECFEC